MSDTIFHRTPPEWFPLVEGLAPGKRVRDEGHIMSFNGKAYHRWSFRDKQSEVYEPQLTLAQRLENNRLLNEANEDAIQTNETPEPRMGAVQDWPAEARVWMYKAHLNNDDIHAIGAYWNPRMQRVIIPYVGLDGTRSWIGRAMGRTPDLKYLFPKDTRRGGGALVKADEPEYPKTVVITEDYLSAYRVTKDTNVDSVSAMGTSLDRAAILAIAKAYDRAIVWLDPDKYGRMGQNNIRRQLGQLGLENYGIASEADPKLLDAVDIDDAVNNILSGRVHRVYS